ncbi:toll/interleukin-1 receptor domain-containing protein [Lentzea kentuckyensis]|uniref:toll/interleukin-1 receptor domain-containing protein n=1 Tax=Lentzea kentuckyensis TaxID=360086 RepID=UPI000A3A39E4|nr:toll/interleukin-1 receptor domain-containing protein [Lentzea kentuckyensis]
MTDYLWDVFVSHSTSSAPDGTASRLLDELITRFPLAACRIQADRTFLVEGERWEEGIRDAINDSHLGLVLLDENALRSRWVRRETRQMLDQPREKNYRIIPILIGIRPARVKQEGVKEFTRLMDTLQALIVEADAVDEAVRKLVEVLRLNVLGDIEEGEMSLVKRLTEYLPENQVKLANMYRRLKEQPKPPPLLPREELSFRILRSKLDRNVTDLIIDSKHHFLTKVSDDGREMFTDMLASSWIDFEVANRAVEEHPDAPQNRRHVCVLGTSIGVATGEQLVRRATHWDEVTVDVQTCGDVPVGDPAEIKPLLLKQYEWPNWTDNYLVLQEGSRRGSRLNGVLAAQDAWPDVMVVLVIGPDTDLTPDDFAKHLGENYCHTVVAQQDEHSAKLAMDRIRKHLGVRRQAS